MVALPQRGRTDGGFRSGEAGDYRVGRRISDDVKSGLGTGLGAGHHMRGDLKLKRFA